MGYELNVELMLEGMKAFERHILTLILDPLGMTYSYVYLVYPDQWMTSLLLVNDPPASSSLAVMFEYYH